MGNRVHIQELMETSGVRFGTSGARGLAEHITDYVAFCYTSAFLQHLEKAGSVGPKGNVLVGGDRRESTPRIIAAICKAIETSGREPMYCGELPSPALALEGMKKSLPSIMVTGSHIPKDRNGIKFTSPLGEITKSDEEHIRQQAVEVPDGLFDDNGALAKSYLFGEASPEAYDSYDQRYLKLFPKSPFQGLRIGLYMHSLVDQRLPKFWEELGAEVIPFGHSEVFVPVDTEAIREEDREVARAAVQEHKLAAIFSTDGDSDRPLVADETGEWIPGDVLGIMTAHELGIKHIATPVSCTSAVDSSGHFAHVARTRIGSPFVIAAMEELPSKGAGFEANGGFLLGGDAPFGAGILSALPTRDARIVHLAALHQSIRLGKPLSEIRRTYLPPYKASNRLENYPSEISGSLVERLRQSFQRDPASTQKEFFPELHGTFKSFDDTDGLKVFWSEPDAIVHIRPSGNAPEFRCYVEAASEKGATELLDYCLAEMVRWKSFME